MARERAARIQPWLDGSREEMPREEAPREEAPREGAPREEAPREEAPREEAPREEAPREGAPREEAPRQALSPPLVCSPTGSQPTRSSAGRGWVRGAQGWSCIQAGAWRSRTRGGAARVAEPYAWHRLHVRCASGRSSARGRLGLCYTMWLSTICWCIRMRVGVVASRTMSISIFHGSAVKHVTVQ